MPALHLWARSLIVPPVNVNEIRELYSAVPFEPFELVLTNGARLLVDHPEFMSFSHDFRTVVVHKLNGGVHFIDAKMIVGLNVPPQRSGKASKKKK